ncbi:MAG: hypothetical protein PHY43_02565 [Verrucomicrobiales bacterium]|nr:hypothetical protein [Verrucomicrobiales bacterium]
MRQLAIILFLFAAAGAAAAGETNYFCIVCGKGPLYGQIWLHPRGPVCDGCHKLENRCSLCGLPVRDGDGSVKTGDGRFICKFDKTNAVLDVDAAREIFENARQDATDLYGRRFMLKYPDVTVNMFDVDYWSEKGRDNGLDKYGFASTRRTPGGQCTHEVVMLSGQLRNEMISTAAHEYTHLWIYENCPSNRVIAGDTVEAICELTAYKLMQKQNLPEMQKRILENPYTHGKIKTLVEIEKRYDTDYVLDWVKNGKTETIEEDTGFSVRASPPASASFSYVPPVLPQALKFSGLLTIGKDRQAVINGVAFAAGDQKQIKLKNKTVLVRCREIRDAAVMVELNGSPDRVTLKLGEEKSPP